jgi:ABC-type Fe3+/spermidine/putrescine transport system ATPase subunit
MNGGRVEQLGSPHEIYEHPETPFVADFIGSLNALELRVDELVGSFAVMRVADRERVVVAVDDGVRAGDSLRVAVRPEQVQIAPAGDPELNQGSRLTGAVTEVVYLGMYTQFHVETRAGRVVCHRLADEPLAQLLVGAPVTVSWQPEQTSVLAAAS